MIGKRVIVTKTDHRGLTGTVTRIERDVVHIRPDSPAWGTEVRFLREYVEPVDDDSVEDRTP